MLENVKYWLQDEPTQNFGDYLSEYLLHRLFMHVMPTEQTVRIIGSCIDDMFLPPGERVLFWGCGLREPGGLSETSRPAAELLSVRGPLSRSDLRLGMATPIGDPGLLLPFLHAPDRTRRGTGRSLLIPHYHDKRSDSALLELSGCDVVLRPNISDTLTAIDDFLNRLAEAEFVLGGSMHAVIAAAAYGVPFGFWDSGEIDLPFKWKDFAASIGIPCRFHRTLAPARDSYEQEVATTLTIPPLWPMLAVAPFPVRPDIFVRALSADVARHGTNVLALVAATPTVRWRSGADTLIEQLRTELAAERELSTELREQVDDAKLQHSLDRAALDQAEAARAREREDYLLVRSEAEREAERARASELEWEEQTRLEQEITEEVLQKTRDELSRVSEQNDALRAQLECRTAEITALQQEQLRPPPAGVEVEVIRAKRALVELEARYDALTGSTSWRALEPLRRAGRRAPGLRRGLRRSLRLLLWTARGQVLDRLKERDRMTADVDFLRRHPLFDAAWYAARHAALLRPGLDPATHYVWSDPEAGHDPHPLFDGRWYLEQLRASTIDRTGAEVPLLHYIRIGDAAGLDPHPLFDTAYYLSQPGSRPQAGVTALEHYLDQATDVRAPNRLFDARGYRFEHMGDVSISPLAHYVETGEALDLDPHPAFDSLWYRTQHPDCGRIGPLAHCVRAGTVTSTRQWPEAVGRLEVLPLAFPATDTPLVSIVIPAYGAYAQTFRCLLALMQNTTGGLPYEVILADDRPADPVAPLYSDVPNLRSHVNPQNLGFLRNCNRAASRARGEYIVFLNNDALVGRDWLRPLVALMADPTVGLVGCKLLNTDGTVQEAGGAILSDGWGWPYGAGDQPTRGAYNFVREVDVVTGACFLVGASAFSGLGGFDDRYAPAFYEEFDLAIALRECGLRTLYQPASQVVHLGSASYGVDVRDRQSLKNHARFVEKWRALLPGQPSQVTPAFVVREHRAPRGVILVIDDKVPEYDKHAGAVTLFQYLGLMHELGLKVIYHPFDGLPAQPYTNDLQQRGIEVLHAPDTLAAWLDRDGTQVDFVWIARPYVAAPTLDLLRRTTGARILYYTHDLHYLREMRRFELEGDLSAREEHDRVKPMELGIFAIVDRVMTPSEEEARIIAEAVPQAHVTVIPPYLYPATGLADPATLDFSGRETVIFVGGFDHTPNVDAALWLAREIMPLVWRQRPDVCLLIVGNVPPEEVRALASERITVTGFVPSLEPYYARSRIAVSPLRYGAGVKGKIVGSLRAAVPVITTSVGNEGIRLRHGIEALIADDAAGIARAILDLCADEALCRSLATAGMAVLERQFSEDRARSVLLDLLGNDTCPICGARPRFAGPRGANWRESFSCLACGALNRTAALAEVLLRPYRRQRLVTLRAARATFAALRVHEFGFVGPVQAMLGDAASFSRSDFFPDVPPGALAPNGVQCQDLQALTLADTSIDLAISQDVMEHVPDMERAWKEIHRVLRPGGRHVFTIPYSTDRAETMRRAELSNGAIRHILPPEYHGDPIREEGALAFWDYGADLPELLRRIGFAVTVHEVVRSGHDILVFETIKTRFGTAGGETSSAPRSAP